SPYVRPKSVGCSRGFMNRITNIAYAEDPMFRRRRAEPQPASPHDDTALLDAYSKSVIDVVDRLGPTVGRLRVRAGQGPRQAGTGSGVVVAPDGLVLTNSHVVAGETRLDVTTQDGRTLSARVVGDDPDTELALVRINESVSLPSATLGDSKR